MVESSLKAMILNASRGITACKVDWYVSSYNFTNI